MNDFKAVPEELRRQQILACEKVLRSGWYILGNEVQQFEKKWADTCGVEHAVSTGNGMDAIEIGLRALGIGKGDEVITTSVTAFATILAIIRAGAEPIIADVDLNTGLLSLSSVKRCVSPRTKAILLVHLYGHVKDMDIWQEFSNDTGVYLLEDCAQSHLATWNGKSCGSFGLFGAFSFYPTKNLGAVGDGGALVTNNQKISDSASMLRNYGQSERYHHPLLGMNSRLDEIQAALLDATLPWLGEFTSVRRKIAIRYQTEIINPLIEHMEMPISSENHVYHLFVIKCKRRDQFQDFLKSNGISTHIHYPVPLHKQKSLTDVKCDPIGLVNAELLTSSCISIPCHPFLTHDQVNNVIKVINDFR